MHIDGVLEEPGAGRAEEVVAESRDFRNLAFATAGRTSALRTRHLVSFIFRTSARHDRRAARGKLGCDEALNTSFESAVHSTKAVRTILITKRSANRYEMRSIK